MVTPNNISTTMSAHLRIARPVRDLPRSVAMYMQGLGLERLGGFSGHSGFDGVMLGNRDSAFHLEFTVCHEHPIQPTPTQEDLLVFYVADRDAWSQGCRAMLDAGFKEVQPFNPYWAQRGRTFEDRDGYRTVIQHASWRTL